MFLLFSVLFAVWCFHHSTFSAQRYDNFQERQKHTLINLLFWREWNLPLAKFLSVENNKPLKDLWTGWMIGYQVKTLFFGATISSVVYLRCRMLIQAKPMNRKRFWSCLLSNGGRKLVQMRAEPSLLELCRVQPSFCKLLQTVYRLTFSYSKKEVWLPLHPTKEGKRMMFYDTIKHIFM